jgi:hypothetical protein
MIYIFPSSWHYPRCKDWLWERSKRLYCIHMADVVLDGHVAHIIFRF